MPDYDETRGHPISADASGFQLLLFIPISINDRHERAWQRLKQQAPNEYIADVAVTDSWTYAVVGTIYNVRMDAMAYPVRSK